MPSLRPLQVVVLTLFIVPVASAQTTAINDQTSTPTAGTGHNYIHMLNETVNPANGSISIRLQVPIPKGRELTLPFAISYNSDGTWAPGLQAGGGAYNNAPYYGYQAAASILSQGTGGWSYSVPVLRVTGTYWIVNQGESRDYQCPEETGFVFQDASGVSFGLDLDTLDNDWEYQRQYPCGGGSDQPSTGGTDFYSAYTSGFQNDTEVASADGTVYTFPFAKSGCSVGPAPAYTSQMLPSSVEDRNGNILKFSAPTSCNGAFTETDTAGRTVLSASGFQDASDTVTVSGLSQAYTIAWGSTAASTALGSTLRYSDGSCTYNTINNFSGSRAAVSSVTLPNGEKYSFYYDSGTGLLSKIVYPTGGYISYTWAVNSGSEFADLPDYNGVAEMCLYTYDTYALSHRYVSFDGSTVALQQDFSYSTTWNPNNYYSTWTTKSTTVTTHDLVRGITYSTQYLYSPVNAPANGSDIPAIATQIPVEQTITYNDQNAHTLKTVTKSWDDTYLLATEKVALDNGQTSEVAYTYGHGGVVTEKDEYDYGLALKRKTLTTYQGFGATPLYPAGTPVIFDRPCKTLVEDGSSNVAAETDYLYDGGTSVCGTAGTASTQSASTASGTHDETNYGPSSTTPRGNPTKTVRKCLSGCSQDAVTTHTYDETGNVTSTTDPCGNASCSDMSGTNHTTTYSYTDSYSSCSGAAPPSGNTDAYLTQVTDPLGHAQSYCYGYDDGQLRALTDQNSQTTTYKYADSLRRITETDFPDGGVTLISYNDTPPNPSVTTQNKLDSSGRYVATVTVTNGVGSPTEIELTSDPQGTDYTLSTYDGVGKLYTITNPYRTTGDPTYGTTTYTYDVLGRPTSVAKQTDQRSPRATAAMHPW